MVDIKGQVYSEVYDIIYHMEKELFNKIPKEFIKVIETNRDENYKVNIDYSKSINDQELQRETRVILSLIYRDYICSEEERKILIEKDELELKRAEEELREKYSPDNLLKNKNTRTEHTEENKINTEMIVYKENIIKKLFKKIKELFRRN